MREKVIQFRRQAQNCKDRAAVARNPIDSDAWIRLAEEWLTLANASEADATYRFYRVSTNALHPSDGDKKIRALQHFNQFIENDPLIISRSGL